MCGSMVDIQPATAEIRRGKKEERKKKPQDENIMSASARQGGHKKYNLTNKQIHQSDYSTSYYNLQSIVTQICPLY